MAVSASTTCRPIQHGPAIQKFSQSTLQGKIDIPYLAVLAIQRPKKGKFAHGKPGSETSTFVNKYDVKTAQPAHAYLPTNTTSEAGYIAMAVTDLLWNSVAPKKPRGYLSVGKRVTLLPLGTL